MFSKKWIKAKSPLSLRNYLNRGLEEEFAERRSIGLVTPSFATLPPVLSRAPLIATLPARIAYVFANEPDLVVSKLPFEVPAIQQSIVWHAAAESNPAFQWFLERVRAAAGVHM